MLLGPNWNILVLAEFLLWFWKDNLYPTDKNPGLCELVITGFVYRLLQDTLLRKYVDTYMCISARDIGGVVLLKTTKFEMYHSKIAQSVSADAYMVSATVVPTVVYLENNAPCYWLIHN